VNSQLKNFLFEKNILSRVQSGFRLGHSTTTAAVAEANNILSGVQSGFKSGHSTATAAVAVANNINGLDKKQRCAALFVDLSKAFDSGDHELLLARLSNIGLCEGAVNWFRNYLSDRR
jgi:hypothetical protein